MLEGLLSILRIARHKGLMAAYHEIVQNCLYDLRHGVDTATWLPIEQYKGVDHLSRAGEMVRYQATHKSAIRVAITKGAELAGVAVHNTTVLDLGCGKGKVLVEGALMGVDAVIGVELNPDLARIAVNNMCLTARGKSGNYTHLTVYTEDVLTYLGTGKWEANVVFMYNPFTGALMEEVLTLLAAGKASGKRFCVAYVNPEQDDVMRKYFTFIGKVIADGGQQINFYN